MKVVGVRVVQAGKRIKQLIRRGKREEGKGGRGKGEEGRFVTRQRAGRRVEFFLTSNCVEFNPATCPTSNCLSCRPLRGLGLISFD